MMISLRTLSRQPRHSVRSATLFSCAAAALLLPAGPALGQSQPKATDQNGQNRKQAVRFSIPAQDLDSALTRLADQGGIRIFFTSADLSGLRTRGINGQMTVEQALSALLGGSGYGWRYSEARTIMIEKLPADARSSRSALQLGKVRVEGQSGKEWHGGYSLGDASPADSGTSRIDRSTIAVRAPGTGDINQMLTMLPTVQFSNSMGMASRNDLQDIRPEKISISGGSVYENLFIVDGVGVNSRLDMFSDGNGDSYNPANFHNVVAASPQTIWVDSSLIGEVVVRDSNISAEYGQFTGGVVEIKTRNPGTTFGVDAYYGQTSDSFGKFKISRNSRIALEGKDLPQEPDFLKRRYGTTVNLPVIEGFRLLGAYNYSSSSVTNYPGTNYQNVGTFRQKSVSENFMLKGEVDISPDILFRTQVTYSPYDSEFRTLNSIDGLLISNGGGLTTSAALEGTSGMARWKLEFSHAFSDNDRDGPGYIYSISTTGTGLGWCSTGSSCTIGGAGPLNQRQYDSNIKGRWEQPIGPGTFRGGFEYSHIIGKRSRPEEASSYLSADVHNRTVCVGDQGYACVDGSYAVKQRMAYPAFDARAAINSYALWSEYDLTLGAFNMRAGLRYDHENFLGNHVFSPRLSLSYDLPFGLTITGGGNRYYGRSFLGYALREQYGVIRTYTRTPTITGGNRVWSDNWALSSHTSSSRYSNIGLDTPYTDELTLALRGDVPVIGGEFRARGVLRKSKNQFSSSLSETETFIKDTGATATRRVYTITNDGTRDYKGLTLEYNRELGKNHRLTLSTALSKTEASNISYFDVAEDTEWDGALVYYKGEVMPLLQAISDNQVENYANPLVINADISSRWLDGRITTNINARWRDGFERIEDSGVNTGLINGVRYDIYDVVRYKSAVEVNLGINAEVVKTRYGSATIEVRGNNIFNTATNRDYSSTGDPWQMGRNFWLTLRLTH